jgi:hypothetical protein
VMFYSSFLIDCLGLMPSEKSMTTHHSEFQEAEMLLSRLPQCTIGPIARPTSLAAPLLDQSCRMLRITETDYELSMFLLLYLLVCSFFFVRSLACCDLFFVDLHNLTPR